MNQPEMDSGEIKGMASGGQGFPQLHSKLEAIMGSMRYCLQTAKVISWFLTVSCTVLGPWTQSCWVQIVRFHCTVRKQGNRTGKRKPPPIRVVTEEGGGP